MKPPIELAVAALNSAFEADPAAIHALLCAFVPCNRALAEHETVEVGESSVAPGTYTVSPLGFLNGAIRPMTGESIATKWSNELDEDGRRKLLGFCVYTPNA